jgi:hypothetical protein
LETSPRNSKSPEGRPLKKSVNSTPKSKYSASLRTSYSLAISNWFRWSLRPQPVQTYEAEALFAIRFLLPFSAKLARLIATVDLPHSAVPREAPQ